IQPRAHDLVKGGSIRRVAVKEQSGAVADVAIRPRKQFGKMTSLWLAWSDHGVQRAISREAACNGFHVDQVIASQTNLRAEGFQVRARGSDRRLEDAEFLRPPSARLSVRDRACREGNQGNKDDFRQDQWNARFNIAD